MPPVKFWARLDLERKDNYSRWPIIPVALIGGLGIAALIVVSESLYLKQFGREKRGVRVAVYQLSTYLGFGFGAAQRRSVVGGKRSQAPHLHVIRGGRHSMSYTVFKRAVQWISYQYHFP